MKFKTILHYFLIWQVVLIFIVTWSKNIFPLQTDFIPEFYIKNPVLYFRGNFDGIHYINIAKKGICLYEEVFFPLFPKLISLLSPLIHNTVLNGSLISSLFFLLGMYIFAKLIRLDHDAKISFWTIIALLAFPVSFFFTSVYTEGLLFFLIVSAFYFARTKHWWLAAILVALATYTRFIGILLIPALFLELLSQNPKIKLKHLLPFAVMPLGILIYNNYLWEIKGYPFAFVNIQKSLDRGQSAKIILPYQVAYRYVRMLTTVSLNSPVYYTLALESFISLSFIAIGIIMLFKKARPSYILFTLTTLIVPTFAGALTSMPRYALLCFPVFIFIGKHISTNKHYRYLYFTLALTLTVVFLSLFARGYWVA